MKKRTVILPFSLFLLISCTSKPDGDVRNQYNNEDDCKKDNPKEEISKNLDDDDDFDSTKLCEQVVNNGRHYYLGPAYPHMYDGHYGFYNGYWIGRSSMYSQGVIYRSGETFSHSQISSGGGVANTVGKAASTSARGTTVSRGGFGSYGHSSFGG